MKSRNLTTMMNNTQFTPIDFDNWELKERYMYYSQKGMPSFHLTMHIDISNLKQRKLPINIALIYLLNKVVNSFACLRINLNHDNELGYYDYIHPCWFYCVHDELSYEANSLTLANKMLIDGCGKDREFSQSIIDHVLTFAQISPYFADFKTLEQLYRATPQQSLQEAYNNIRNNINFFGISNILWLSHTNFHTHFQSLGFNQFHPNFHLGRAYEKDQRYLLPISGQFLYCIHIEKTIAHMFTQLQNEINLFTGA